MAPICRRRHFATSPVRSQPPDDQPDLHHRHIPFTLQVEVGATRTYWALLTHLWVVSCASRATRRSPPRFWLAEGRTATGRGTTCATPGCGWRCSGSPRPPCSVSTSTRTATCWSRMCARCGRLGAGAVGAVGVRLGMTPGRVGGGGGRWTWARSRSSSRLTPLECVVVIMGDGGGGSVGPARRRAHLPLRRHGRVAGGAVFADRGAAADAGGVADRRGDRGAGQRRCAGPRRRAGGAAADRDRRDQLQEGPALHHGRGQP